MNSSRRSPARPASHSPTLAWADRIRLSGIERYATSRISAWRNHSSVWPGSEDLGRVAAAIAQVVRDLLGEERVALGHRDDPLVQWLARGGQQLGDERRGLV